MLNIAIVSGGDSGEFEVSLKSGKQVELNLDKTKFRPFLIHITKNQWVCTLEEVEFPINRHDFSLTLASGRITFDCVFIAIHGTPGENGILQGYFELQGLPYTSCDVTTSALTFNKSFCKNVVGSYGIFTSKSIHLFREGGDAARKVKELLSLPVFIKPNNGGSSVGMSKVNQWDELEDAIEKAFHEDDQILAEEFIKGRELTCGVIRSKGKVIALPVTEIISKKDFFDFEAKYQDGLANEVVPAEIPEFWADECRKISCLLYEKLNCSGVVRFDYIHDGSRFCFLEVNTVPGLSEQSIVPKMVKAQGWTITDFYTMLIEESLEKMNG
ncbi:MAG: D-alanine--D-alanine ligase [Bacteroidota bacterium]